jgi:hypothetical protein
MRATLTMEVRMTLLIRSILALSLMAPATVALAAAPAQPALQFDQLGPVKAWRAGGENIVFVQDSKGQWYKATLFETCMSLDTSKGVKFQTEIDPATNAKESKVVVDRHICTVQTLAKSDPPPPEKK